MVADAGTWCWFPDPAGTKLIPACKFCVELETTDGDIVDFWVVVDARISTEPSPSQLLLVARR
eukprot:m.331039 g.331039  ORF g.331039 m.331039 type:complete len:63 (-) comp69642_c0_seq1:23-211(-)